MSPHLGQSQKHDVVTSDLADPTTERDIMGRSSGPGDYLCHVLPEVGRPQPGRLCLQAGRQGVPCLPAALS